MSTLVLTGFDDNMFELGMAALGGKKAYAALHGYDFRCVREYEAGTHPSWQKLRLLKEMSHAGYKRILWLDADSVITNPFVSVDSFDDGHSVFTASVDWCAPTDPAQERRFISAGNFLFCGDRPYSSEFLDKAMEQSQYANRPCWEQDAILLCMQRIPTFDAAVHRLPRHVLNSVHSEVPGAVAPWEPGRFLCHLTAVGADARVALAQRYDAEHVKWATSFIPAWWDVGACADKRHINFLFRFLATAGVERSLEIGTHSGCSSSAFVAAGVPDAHYCDISIRSDFESVVTNPKVGHTTIHRARGADVLRDNKPFDFVFVDGNHALNAVEEEVRFLLNKPPAIIAAHDISAAVAGFPYCEGPAYLWNELQRRGWFCVADVKSRPGERTDRGFMIATQDLELARTAVKAYAVSCW